MLDANYQKHFKNLGKICRLYDDGGFSEATIKTIISRLYDQAATGESTDSYGALLALCPHITALNSDLSSGGQVRSRAKEMAASYLISDFFRADLTTVPGSPNSYESVVEALRVEMSAAVDNKTLTNESATGFVHFFKVLKPGTTWNTAADGSANYKDSIYVVQTIV